MKKTITSSILQQTLINQEKEMIYNKLGNQDSIVCLELMTKMIQLYGFNYAMQECSQILIMFEKQATDSIKVADFVDTWVSKHEIHIENETKALFEKLDRKGKRYLTS